MDLEPRSSQSSVSRCLSRTCGRGGAAVTQAVEYQQLMRLAFIIVGVTSTEPTLTG
jgi:hypothetical protein